MVLLRDRRAHLGSPSHLAGQVLRPAAPICSRALHSDMTQCSVDVTATTLQTSKGTTFGAVQACAKSSADLHTYSSAWLLMYSHCVSQLRMAGCAAQMAEERPACQPRGPEGQLRGPVLSTLGDFLHVCELRSTRDLVGSSGCWVGVL